MGSATVVYIKLTLLALGVVLAMGLHLNSGVMQFNWLALTNRETMVLYELRLPRLLMVAVTGAGLAVAGVALQVLLRNPLAEPGLIGVSSSAALGAVAMMALGGWLWHAPAYWQIALAAFIMAMASSAFIYNIASYQGRTDVALMLLAGVAINAVAAALTQFFIFVADDTQLRTMTFWMMGSFANVSWQAISISGLVILSMIVWLWARAQALNLLTLGENTCLHLGFDPQRLKFQVIVATSLMVALAVASVGVIGFVGLIVPHIMRLWCGTNIRWLLPSSALAGALLLLLADWLGKTILSPAELPVGLFMALLGGPFFLLLLLRSKRYWRA